jgi:hypothetical protein
VFIPGLLGGTKPGAGRIGKQIADECMEQLKCVPFSLLGSSFCLLLLFAYNKILDLYQNTCFTVGLVPVMLNGFPFY